jgi:hypothetical protein
MAPWKVWVFGLLHILKDVVVVFREAFHPSVRPVIHPWMASLQPMWLRLWLRFCCTRRNSHIIQQHFYFIFGEISTKKNPVRPLGSN